MKYLNKLPLINNYSSFSPRNDGGIVINRKEKILLINTTEELNSSKILKNEISFDEPGSEFIFKNLSLIYENKHYSALNIYQSSFKYDKVEYVNKIK